MYHCMISTALRSDLKTINYKGNIKHEIIQFRYKSEECITLNIISMTLNKFQWACYCKADDRWGVSRRQCSNPQQHPDRKQRILAAGYSSHSWGSHRGLVSVSSTSAQQPAGRHLRHHTPPLHAGGHLAASKKYYSWKKKEPDSNHCKRYLEDLGSTLSWRNSCDCRIKHPVLPPAGQHFWLSLKLLTATFIRSFQITRSLIRKRRGHLTQKFLFQPEPKIQAFYTLLHPQHIIKMSWLIQSAKNKL